MRAGDRWAQATTAERLWCAIGRRASDPVDTVPGEELAVEIVDDVRDVDERIGRYPHPGRLGSGFPDAHQSQRFAPFGYGLDRRGRVPPVNLLTRIAADSRLDLLERSSQGKAGTWPTSVPPTGPRALGQPVSPRSSSPVLAGPQQNRACRGGRSARRQNGESARSRSPMPRTVSTTSRVPDTPVPGRRSARRGTSRSGPAPTTFVPGHRTVFSTRGPGAGGGVRTSGIRVITSRPERPRRADFETQRNEFGTNLALG
jgi:hypothetical protein